MSKKIQNLLKKQGFTLVELIIVIAIIAVLAVAAFMMLTKWLGHSRDARKIGDVATIKKALNIAFVEKPIYPEPEAKKPIKDLDGNVLWYQGVFGLTSANGIDTLQKAPVNPTDDSYYMYSVTTDQLEYQIGAWLENGDEVSFSNSVFAAEEVAMIEGEYDGYVTYSSGTDGKIIKIPSLILYDGDTIDLSGSNTNLMIEGKSEGEPFEVKNVAFNPENVDNNKLINDIKTTFGMEDDKAAMLVIEDNSSITPSAIIYEGCEAEERTINGHTYNVPSMSHGTSKTVSTADESIDSGTQHWNVNFSCNSGNLSEGTESDVIIECDSGYVESGDACELDQCNGDIPDNAESNATSTGIGTTRNYTTTSGKCTYECKDGFHTEDGGTSCVDDSKTSTCEGTLPTNTERNTSNTYTQTWNGTDWGTTKSANYNTTASTEDCRFKCISGATYSGGNCLTNIIGDDTSGRKWSDGTYATSCNEYKNPSGDYDYTGDTGTGMYWIKPDSTAAFKVYCDMDTNGGGRTRYAYIKDEWNMTDGVACYGGTKISNSALECFNPNRYGMNATTVRTKVLTTNRYFNTVSSTATYSVATVKSTYGCRGHGDYMTIMNNGSTPATTATSATRVRLGLNFCKFGRGVGGMAKTSTTQTYMNYSQAGYGPTPGSRASIITNPAELFIR